jgi:hypothetical protein
MEGTRFDQFARTVATSRSRRRVLGAVLAGVLSSLSTRTTTADDADDSGTVIADASGGNHNYSTVADPAPVRTDREPDRTRNEDDEEDDDDKDKDKNKNKDAQEPGEEPVEEPVDEPVEEPVCPSGSTTFCCQCTNAAGNPTACTATTSTIPDCPSDCGIGNPFAVLEADLGQEFTCVDNTCTPGPC